ncbi:hypothetical protein BUALT_Bualt06G0018800 [Buddleja alternifolia]|uniref:Uncharacterized protein n=1 Tax=Buddleja alternifolia TaxID=168488 RepID=A0AAV6XBK4_9LAMI|nr:hypothetical protein BUALT_Bualt06G0018800 [Buddleja alternifolia]
MPRGPFAKLCYLIKNIGGVTDYKYVTAKEKVALFLSILARHKKIRVVHYDFKRSMQTVSKYFREVLVAVVKLHNLLLVSPIPIGDDFTNQRLEMQVDPLEVDLEDLETDNEEDNEVEYIDAVQSTQAWTKFREEFATSMFNEWRGEEEVLMAGLKEIVVQGWKADNGFKVGYLGLLEQHMIRAFPSIDLHAMPHINSRIHVWKKNYASLSSMLTFSGIGFNHTTNMIETHDEEWENYVKVFGKDRATGEHVVDFVEAVNHTVNKTYLDDDVQSFEDLETLNEHNEGEVENINVSQAQSSASAKNVGQKKRKLDSNQEQMYEFLGNYCKNTNSRLREFAIRIGVECDVANAKKVVYAAVNKVERLTLHQKLFVTNKLVKKTEDVYPLFRLPEIEQAEYIRMKQAGILNLIDSSVIKLDMKRNKVREPNWEGLSELFGPDEGAAEVIDLMEANDDVEADRYESDELEEFQPHFKNLMIKGLWGWSE